MVHAAGLYVQVTDHGGIYTSTNRLNWVRRESGTSLALRAAAWMGSRLLVTGEAGTVLWSDDAVTFRAGTLATPTTDWLEGVAALPGRAVAVGDNGAVFTTTNGLAWTRVTGLPFVDWLTGVAAGAGVFVAVGDGGLVATSPNGTSWTRRNSGTVADLQRIAFGDGRFLAVGRNGVVLTSVNGLAWNADTATGITNTLYVGLPASGERVVAGESAFLLRRPPAPWTDQSSATVSPSPVPVWSWSALLWDGTRYLAGGRTGVTAESWRTNAGALSGETFWFRNDDSPRNLLWDVIRVGHGYLAVGDVGTVLSSSAGVDWTSEGAPVTAETVLYGIGGSPEVVVAVGSSGTVLRSAVGSTNVSVTHEFTAAGGTHPLTVTRTLPLTGVEWQVSTPVTTNTLQGVAWNRGLFVVTGAQGTVLTSSDAVTWRAASIAGAGLLSSVTAHGDGFVAAGSAGRIDTSADGTNWVARNSGTTNWVYRVRSLAGTLVAVGQNGTLLTSTEGVDWVARASGSDAFLTDACRVGRYVYVCGTGGTLLRSADLSAWEVLPTITGKSLFALATDGAQVVAVGAEGTVVRAIGDDAASPVAFAGYARRETAGGPVEGFVFSGSPERDFRLESGVEPGPWIPAAGLRLDAAGIAVLGRDAVEASRFHRTAAGP